MKETKLNIHQAKTHLSRYLTKMRPGTRIVLCRRNVPIAEVRPLEKAHTKIRRIGSERGRLQVPATFFEPLPDDMLRDFSGV